MRCIIHIGAEKTGSTSLQNCLFNNREFLLDEHGLFVAANPNGANLTWLAKAAALAASGVAQDDALRQKTTSLRHDLQHARGHADRCVVTTEHFHSKLSTKESVAHLKAMLDPVVDSYSVVCYLRRQDELAVSRYSTALRAGYTNRPVLPRPKAGTASRLLDFDRLLDRWSAVFGQDAIHARIYDRSQLVDGDVGSDFFSLLGLPAPPTAGGAPSNTSLTAEAQVALATFNAIFNETPGQQSKLHRDFVAHLERHYSGRGMLPSRRQALEFTQRFQESNSQCARRWFGRDQLFNDDYSRYGDQPTAADQTEVARILGSFLVDAGQQVDSERSSNP